MTMDDPSALTLSAIDRRTLRLCPVCGDEPLCVRTIPSKTDIRGDALSLASCARCGALYQPVRYDASELADWYEYVATVDAIGAEPSELLGRRVDRLMSDMEPYRSAGRMLDVGCGRGTVSLAASERGWAVHATEVSAGAVRALRSRLGDRIHQGDLLDAPFDLESFDVVLMIEVIEHLVDPGAYVGRALELLRPGGALFVTTPNAKGLSGRLLGTRWRVVAEEHLTYLQERTLRQLLESHGFSSVRIATTGADIPFAYAALRAIGRRVPTASDMDGRVTRPSRRSITAPLADRAIELANGVLRRTGLGDTLRAIAERPDR